MELRNSVAHFHLSLQTSAGTSLPLTLQQMSSEGVVLTEKHAAGTTPTGVHSLLQPNAADPNQAFRETPLWTKSPMKISDIVKAANRFIALRAAIEAFSEKSSHRQQGHGKE